MAINSSSANETTRPSLVQRVVTSRWFIFLVAVTVVFGLASTILEHVRSNALKDRLVGTWTIPVTLKDGSVEQWIEEFRSDGTMRFYDPGEPQSEIRRIGYWKWHISGSDLVIIYETQINPDAPLLRRVRQFGRFMIDRVKGDDYELVYSQRYAIHDDGGDTISFTHRPEGEPLQEITITRVSAENH